MATDIEDLVISGNPLDRLRAHFLKLVKRTEQTGLAYGCLLGTFSAGSTMAGAQVRAEAQDAFATWTAAVVADIAEAQSLGEVSSRHAPQELATYLIDAFEGAALHIKVTGDPGILSHFLDITCSFGHPDREPDPLVLSNSQRMDTTVLHILQAGNRYFFPGKACIRGAEETFIIRSVEYTGFGLIGCQYGCQHTRRTEGILWLPAALILSGDR